MNNLSINKRASEYPRFDNAKVYEAMAFIEKVLGSSLFGDDKLMFSVDFETGANCLLSIIPARSEQEMEELKDLLQQNSCAFFGTGSQCSTMSSVWRMIKEEFKLPELISWDSAAVIALIKLGTDITFLRKDLRSGRLMGAWATLLVSPDLIFDEVN